jgi:DNA gyrase subunit A
MRQLENGAENAEPVEDETAPAEENGTSQATLPAERFAELAAREEFILTVASSGFGKRSSAYDYRITARGGKGIDLMDLGRGEATVVAAYPVKDTDQIVLVTQCGQLIRCPINDVRVAGRTTRGVKLFAIDGDDRVVSVTRIGEEDCASANSNGSEGADPLSPPPSDGGSGGESDGK